MIAGLKPYPEYRESGLGGADAIPCHWSESRLRHVCKMLVSSVDKHFRPGELPVRLCNYVDVYKNERIHSHLRFVPASASSEEVERFRIRIHDVIVTKDSESWNDIGVPSLVECEAPDLVCGYHLAILRPRLAQLVGGYLLRALQCPTVSFQCHVEAHGVTRFGLSHGAIRNINIPIPPPDEQAAIVCFLDHATRKIDRAIRVKRKLIALLNEQKQVIIQRAVTRGLDPTVPLKPSGVPWLGGIPEHWEVTRIKNEFQCLDSCRVPLSSVERGEMKARDYDYYGASGIIDQVDDYLFDDELLLLAEDGANLVLRNLPLAIVARGKFWVNNHAHVLKPRRGNIQFLASALECISYQPWISGAAQPKLTQDRLMSIAIAAPAPDEQEAIVKHTEYEVSPLTTAISRADREITLLREFRTRLVADVVTGKLDVREAARHLPDDEDPLPEAGEAEEDVGDEVGFDEEEDP